METQKTSKLFRLNFLDVLKGILISAVSAVLTVAQNSFSAGSLHLDINNVTTVAATAGTAYLLKNVFTPQSEVKKIE